MSIKRISIMLTATILMAISISCTIEDPNSTGYLCHKDFKIYDIEGNQKDTFEYGEEIYMNFPFQNESNELITFNFTEPMVNFIIYQDENQVASALDGLPFRCTPQEAQINPNEIWDFEMTYSFRHKKPLKRGTYLIKAKGMLNHISEKIIVII